MAVNNLNSPFQEWAFTKEGQIKHLDLCITLTDSYPGSAVKLYHCTGSNQNQVRIMLTNMCMEGNYGNNSILKAPPYYVSH